MRAPFTCHSQLPLPPALLRQARSAAARLLQSTDPRARAILSLPQHATAGTDRLVANMTALLDGAKDMVFLGTGGSSLGAQALAQLAGWGTPAYALAKPTPRLHFLDNLDAVTCRDFFDNLEAKTARFVVISKSGATLETLAHCLLALACLQRHGIDDLRRHFLFVTEPGANPLRALAQRLDAPILEHDPNLPGRFSVLGATGQLALLATGQETAPLLAGAGFVLDCLQAELGGHENAPLEGFFSPLSAVAAAVGANHAGYENAVLLAYSDHLRAFGEWQRQLWMESLGKQGHNASLVCALGPADQHSQLQAWLDGRQANWFTLLCPPPNAYACRMDAQPWGETFTPLLHGLDVHELTAAQSHATEQALAARGAPVRRFELCALDGYALGGLFMHFMLETMLAAAMLGIDPFGQPAVEQVKQATKADLQARRK